MGGVRLKNISKFMSSMKYGSKKNIHLKKCINCVREFESGVIPESDLFEILNFFSDLGPHAQKDKKAIENRYDVEMPEVLSGVESARTEVRGLLGTKIYNSVDNIENNTEASPSDLLIQIGQISNYKNAEWISQQIETISKRLHFEVAELGSHIEHDIFQINGLFCHPNQLIPTMLGSPQQIQIDLNHLNGILISLKDLHKYERRHQVLAYASLGPSKDFTYLYESCTDVLTLYQKMWQSLTPSSQACTRTVLSSTFKEALPRFWILEDGPKQAIRIVKENGLFKSAASKSFDLKLRFLSDPEMLKLDLIGVPNLSLESKDGVAVKCKVEYGHRYFENNSLIIRGICFKSLQRLSDSDLAIHQNFYVLKLNLQVSCLDDHFDLEFKTFPFTVYESAHQIHESTGAVTWLVFSQDEKSEDKYELKKRLPRKEILQMFNQMLKYNTENGGRRLDGIELKELNRLLGRQNPGNPVDVEMKSIFTDKMKTQDAVKQEMGKENLAFSLFTWFRGGLNTLAHFYECWMKGIIVGFYSKDDASNMLKNSCKEGNAVIRLSQYDMHHHQGETPFTAVTVHIVRPGTKKKFFIGSFQVSENLSFQTLVSHYICKQIEGNNSGLVIKQFLPKGIPVSDEFPELQEHSAGSVERNRYFCRFIKTSEKCLLSPETERLGDLTLDDKSTPESCESQSPCRDSIYQTSLQYQMPSGDLTDQTALQDQNSHTDQSHLEHLYPHSVSGSEEPPCKLFKRKNSEVITGSEDPILTSAALSDDLENLQASDLMFYVTQ